MTTQVGRLIPSLLPPLEAIDPMPDESLYADSNATPTHSTSGQNNDSDPASVATELRGATYAQGLSMLSPLGTANTWYRWRACIQLHLPARMDSDPRGRNNRYRSSSYLRRAT
jgi:hypothetical protein